MDARVATFFEREFSGGQVLGNLDQSIGQETWPPENSNLNRIFYCLAYHPVCPSYNHVLG